MHQAVWSTRPAARPVGLGAGRGGRNAPRAGPQPRVGELGINHLVGLCYSRREKSWSWSRSTGWWQVRQRPAQQRRTGCRSSTVCGSVRPAAGLAGTGVQGEEGVGAGDERGVVVEAEVASAFVVVEAELAFELPVVELDRPAQPGEPGEPLARFVLGEVGEPVVAGRLRARSGHSMISHSKRGGWWSSRTGWAATTRTKAKRLETASPAGVVRQGSVCQARPAAARRAT